MSSIRSHRGSSRLGGSPESRRLAARRGSAKLIAIAVLAVIAIGAMAWINADRLQLGFGKRKAAEVPTYQVQRGPMDVVVSEAGIVEGSRTSSVDCQVPGGTSIVWIVPDGTIVKAGDDLLKLVAAPTEETVLAQASKVEERRAALVESERLLATARISLEEYKQGHNQQPLTMANDKIEVAQQNLKQAEATLEFTKKMSERGIVTRLQLDSNEFAVQRAERDLAEAETAKQVLVEFTNVKKLEELDGAVASAAASVAAAKAALESEEGVLKGFREQKESLVTAPRDGMVIHAATTRSNQPRTEFKAGSLVREGQTIVRLHGLDELQITSSLHASQVGGLRINVGARITVQGRTIDGTVISVVQKPDQDTPDGDKIAKDHRRLYAAVIQIKREDARDLKPGMNAQVEIAERTLSNVLAVPRECVVKKGTDYFCWVKRDDSTRKAPVVVGKSNDELVEITHGLAEGELVVRNPSPVAGDVR